MTIRQAAMRLARKGALAAAMASLGATSAYAGTTGATVWFGGESAGAAPVQLVRDQDGDGVHDNWRQRNDGRYYSEKKRFDKPYRAERREKRRDAERRDDRRRAERRAERRWERRDDRRRAARRADRRWERRAERRRELRRAERRWDRRWDRRRWRRGYYDDYGRRYKDDDNRDVALGVLGAVVGLGVAAAIADGANDGYARDDYATDGRSGDRCGYWADQCAGNWGYNNSNFYGCMRYHGCE